MSTPALQLIEVSKAYPEGPRALSGVSLSVAEGEALAIVGESGCGKTTLLRLFNRTVEPTAGAVLVRGAPTVDLDPVALRRRTGYVQQDGGLLPHWSVGRNVELVPTLLGWDAHRRRRRADEMLARVGLEPARFRRRYPSQLSGGERQRVAVARALAADPPVILLDEPFGALDALTRLELQRQFSALRRTLPKTVVLVTHDLDEAFRLADRVAVMQGGRLHQAAPPDELRARPASDYVARLLSLSVGVHR